MVDGVNVVVALSYREAQFTPSEVVNLTGLSLTLQRDWRSAGHIRPRESGRASFSPRDVAEIRLMVKLRNLGVGIAEGRIIAQKAASSLLYIALDQPKGLAVDPPLPTAQGRAYLARLERETDGGFRDTIAGTTAAHRYRYAVIKSGSLGLLFDLSQIPLDDPAEEVAYISLAGSAVALTSAAPRALFTLIAAPE